MRAGVRNCFLFLTCFITLAGLLPLLLVQWNSASASNPAVWAAFAVVMYSSLRLSWLLARGHLEWLNAGFWVFTYVFMGLALLAQIVANRFPEEITYSVGTLTLSSMIILAGCLAYDIGRSLYREPKHRNPIVLSPSIGRVALISVLGLVFVGGAISRFGLVPFFTSRDAVDALLQNREGVTAEYIRTADKAGGQLVEMAVTVPVFVACYMLLIARKEKSYRQLPAPTKMALGILLGALLVGNVIVNNPLGRGRFWAGLVLMGFAAVFVQLRKPTVFRTAIVLFVCAFLLVFSALDAFRRTGSRDFSRGGTVSEVLLTQYDYGISQIAHETVYYVQSKGHSMGRQLTGAGLFWIPRRFWPDKPIPTGPLVSRGFVRVASPLWSEGYVDFGLTGTVLLLAFYGWGSRRLDDAFSNQDSPGLAAMMPLLVGYQFILIRGALIPSLSGLVVLLVIARTCLRRTRQLPAQGEPISAIDHEPAPYVVMNSVHKHPVGYVQD